MHEKYERKVERKLCYFIKDYVQITVVKQRWMLADGSWQEEDKAEQCPRVAKCRRAEHNCMLIHPDSGKDPFVPFGNLLADMW